MNVTFAKYDMDTGYVYAKLSDGNIVLIDCTAYEKAYAENMYQRSELDYLIYNAPLEYVELILSGEIEDYLHKYTDYSRLD